MIPVKLRLTNFMPYRDAELDFSGIHIGCLTGDNGAGKSSLLDAITWAVWGRARSKRDDELVHQGQTEMQVEFTFALGSNVYRIVRGRKAGKRSGAGVLDFQVLNPLPTPSPVTTGEGWGGGAWRTIAEPNMNATQNKIIDLLRLDYDTFINSAFLLQGHADEFTVKTPTERKKVLADILGLDIWEDYEARAKEKVAAIENELRLIDLRLSEIDEEIERRPQFEAEVAAAQKAVIELGDQLREAEAKYQQAQQAQRAIGMLDAQLDDLIKRIVQAERELAAVESDLALARSKADDTPLSIELNETQVKIEALSQRESMRDEVRQHKSNLNEEAASLRGQNDRLGPETEPLKARIVLLEASTEPLCPTCGQPLTPDHREQVVTELRNEVESRRKLFRENQVRLKSIQTEVASVDGQLTLVELELRSLPTLHRRAAELLAAIEAAKEAAKSIETLEKRRSDWQASLEVDRQKQTDIAAQIGVAKAGLGDFATIQAEYERTRSDEARARQALGAAEQKLAACEAMIKQRNVKLAERKKWSEEKGIYEELRLAFSKKGVPAMIIEAAIPEIEDEANALLSRITGGRMHVRFDTQRETVKGDVVETLDIKIADELGTRPYENYSVDGTEMVCIRRNGHIDHVPIEDLWQADAPVDQLSDGYEIHPVNFESLCYQDGQAVWLPATSILRHAAPSSMVKIALRPGNYSVTLTSGHSVFVMTPAGLAVKRGDEIRPGDWLLTPRRIPDHQDHPQVDLLDWISPEFTARRKRMSKPLQWDNQMIWSRRDQPLNRYVPNSIELAEFLGWAVAEASGRNTVSFAVGSDREIAERVVALSNRLFGVSRTSLAETSAEAMARYVANAPGISSISPKEQFRPVVGGRLLAHVMGNLIGHGAKYKHIPANIFRASQESQRAFLKALISGDGHVRVRPARSHAEIGITTISPRLVADTILLCRQLGIWARVESHDVAGFRRGMQHQQSYRVAIGGQANVQRVFDEIAVTPSPHPGTFEGIPRELIGLKRTSSQKRLKRTSSDELFQCGRPVVPKNHRVQYEQMMHWLQDWAVLEVASVEIVPPKSPYVYDLVVPNNHSFVAGTGLILVHNSGGEQFRVNFAIRIALSKLLARRAGAQLQTLVVDEGFGALDSTGRDSLVEAINVIQDEFQRILVITHLDELKDAFPVRIEVTKTPHGSQIAIA